MNFPGLSILVVEDDPDGCHSYPARLRGNNTLKRIPVVMLTSSQQSRDVNAAYYEHR